MQRDKAQIEYTPHTEMHSAIEMEAAEKAVDAMKEKVKEYTDMVDKVRDLLAETIDPFDMSAREIQLTHLMKELKEYQRQEKQAARHRDEVALDIPKAAQMQGTAAIKKDEKKIVAAQDDVNAFKLRLAEARTEEQRSDLKAKLDKAKKALADAKLHSKRDEFMPAIKEASFVTKLEKESLLKEKQKSLDNAKDRLGLKQDELGLIARALKRQKDPQMIFKLVHELANVKTKMVRFQKHVEEKNEEVNKVLKLTGKSGNALVNKLKDGIASAEREMKKMQDTIPALQKEIDTSSDPEKVKEKAAEVEEVKKEIDDEKTAIAETEAKEHDVEEVVEAEVEEEPKEPTRMEMLQKADPELEVEAESVDTLKAKLQAANQEFAAAINNVLRRKENKMKHAERQTQEELATDETLLNKAKARYKNAKRIMAYEGKAAQAYNAIKSELLAGNFKQAENVHEAHKLSQNQTHRTPEVIAQDQMELETAEPSTGKCSLAKCCLKSFKDIFCKVDLATTCRDTLEKSAIGEPRSLIPVTAVFNRTREFDGAIESINRTMHVQARWVTKSKTKVDLELLVCGKFTKFGEEGSTVCFPQEADGSPKGLSFGEIVGAKPGQCVRTADFVDVARDKLKREVASGMALLKKMNAARKTNPKATQIDTITEAVSRAIGGVFKGELGGISEVNERELSLVTLLDESSSDEWEDMLQVTGALMITSVPNGQEPDKAEAPAGSAEAKKGPIWR